MSDRRALVTGSSAGIGFALAKGLSEAGAEVVLNGRDADELEQAAARLRAQWTTVHAVCFDVTSPDDVKSAIERIECDIGAIDILINNDDMQRRAPLEKFSHVQWEELMKTNVESVFLVGKVVGKYMIEHKRGKIINICLV